MPVCAADSSSDPARQLTARCLAERAASPHRVAAEIKEAWLRDLRYSYWEAHLLRVNPASVELDVATRIGEDGYFITGTIIVTWSDSADPSKDHESDVHHSHDHLESLIGCAQPGTTERAAGAIRQDCLGRSRTQRQMSTCWETAFPSHR